MLLLHLEIGDAVAQQSADPIVPFVDGDGVTGPGELLGGGEPAGPEPTTATVFPVRLSGGWESTQPFANAWSMIETSTCLMVTAGWLMPSTQELSHGAGHSRPVNSGKLLVA